MEINRQNWRDLSILLVGCGSIGKRHARVLSDLGSNDIRACDPNQAQLTALLEESPWVKACPSYEAGLAQKPDAVFILTPTKLHIPMALQALRAGCHVFLEKPLSDSMAGVTELTGLAEQTGKQVMVGFCFRYHQGLLQAKKMLAAGKIGRLVSVRALMGEHFPEVRPDYKNTYYAKYSGAFELIHDLDLAIWYAGQPVTEIYGVSGSFSGIGFEAPDLVEMLLKFEDRCVATVHLDFFQKPRRRQMELIGTDGVIIIEFADWDRYTLSVYDSVRKNWAQEVKTTKRDDMFRDEDREFLENIANGGSVVCNIAEACKTLRVIETIKSRSL